MPAATNWIRRPDRKSLRPGYKITRMPLLLGTFKQITIHDDVGKLETLGRGTSGSQAQSQPS